MKRTCLLLVIAGVLLGLAACKKDNKSVAVIGKWQETKLRIYSTDSTGAFLYDTTFLKPSPVQIISSSIVITHV
jgi:hypothetical protein